MFNGNASGRKIYVAPESAEAYKSAQYWSSYADDIVGLNIETCPKLTYTSTDGNIVVPYDADAFGATIVSNVYADGKGIITFDGDITSIGDRAFSNCSNLASITIPETVTSIGDWTFSYCSNLMSVYCKPTTVPTGRNTMFYDNANGRRIYVPAASVDAYKAADGWSYYADDIVGINMNIDIETCPKLTYTSTDGNIITPNDADAFGATIVGNTYANGVGTIYFDGEITSIGDLAFRYCTSLASITIPEGVTSIGSSAFYGCTSLTSITIPSSVASIGNWAFCECTSLTSITIPNSVTSIGGGAFYGCSSLTAFYGKFASIDNRCLIIDKNLVVFAYSGLTAYTIPEGVTSIGGSVFSGCTALTSVIIPEGVTSIGGSAFEYCKSLTSITIPSSVTSIGEQAFMQCYGLTAFYGKFATEDNKCLVVDNELIAYAPAVTDTEYTVPSNVTVIKRYAFFGCENLASIILPEGLTRIGIQSFSFCTITSITLPSSVTQIDNGAFYKSDSLVDVFCRAATPPTMTDEYNWGQCSFDGNAAGRKIHVPTASVDAYKAADGWSTYADYIVGYDFE